jgi:hypothetical protein
LVLHIEGGIWAECRLWWEWRVEKLYKYYQCDKAKKNVTGWAYGMHGGEQITLDADGET